MASCRMIDFTERIDVPENRLEFPSQLNWLAYQAHVVYLSYRVCFCTFLSVLLI